MSTPPHPDVGAVVKGLPGLDLITLGYSMLQMIIPGSILRLIIVFYIWLYIKLYSILHVIIVYYT